MSLILGDGTVIVGPGNSPYVGDNGNWWVGEKDTNVQASADIHYCTSEQFRVATDEGVYYVSDDDMDVEEYFINSKGAKYPITSKNILVPVVGDNGNWFVGGTDLGIPVSGDGSTIAGASIDDESVNGTTTYSSFKIKKLLEELSQEISDTSGKSLEFDWDGTNLGVRVEGQTEYSYQDIKGNQGLCGIDGSSVVDADLTDDGDLILSLQSDVYEKQPSTVVSFAEDGILTAQEITNIQTAIARLNKEISNIKNAKYRKYAVIPYSTDELLTVVGLNGSGSLQIFISKFTGTIKLSVDGNTYTKVVNSLDSISDYSLIGIQPDNSGLYVEPMFAESFTRSLDINFSKGLTLEIDVDENDEDIYPKILIQGTKYAATSSGGSGDGSGSDDDDFIPIEDMTELDVDDMMGLSIGLM